MNAVVLAAGRGTRGAAQHRPPRIGLVGAVPWARVFTGRMLASSPDSTSAT